MAGMPSGLNVLAGLLVKISKLIKSAFSLFDTSNSSGKHGAIKLKPRVFNQMFDML